MAKARSRPKAKALIDLLDHDSLVTNLIENGAIPTFFARENGDVFYANNAFADLLGYSREECLSLGIATIIHPGDIPVAHKQHDDAITGVHSAYHVERRYLRKDGDLIWVMASVIVYRGSNGGPVTMTIQAIDIDDQKRAEMQLAESEARWNTALESGGQGVWDHDFARGTEFYSRTWKAMRGIDPEDEVVDGLKNWITRLHPDDHKRLNEEVASQNDGQLDIRMTEYRERHADGHWIWILSRGRAIAWTPDGKPARIIGTDTDISDIKIAESQLQFANTLLTTAMETSPDAILVADPQSRIISFNQRFASLWNIDPAVLETGGDKYVFDAIDRVQCDPAAARARIEYLYAHPKEESHDELETTDGRIIDRHTGVLNGPDGAYLGRVWFYRDITEERHAQELILQTARTDVLTGLANRTVFLERLQAAIEETTRSGGGFAVFYLDLDNFKDVNDTLGHPVGDELLKTVAARLKGSTRNTDIAARFGGDEFAILLSEVDDLDTAAMIADKLIETLDESITVGGNLIHTGASVGITFFGKDRPDAETMLSRADLALYQAKSEGRGEYRFYNEKMNHEVRHRVALSTELRHAISAGDLLLHYQPQVNIVTGAIIGLEALVRWNHPERGLIAPGEFIPAAEKSGLIAEIGRFVLVEACKQGAAWINADICPATLAVNLSAIQFKRPMELQEDVDDALKRSGMTPSRLELELTETVLMTASREHNVIVTRLRDRGMKVAIDDFGVGFSSLDYLRRFPVDRIKIAQEFVRQIESENGSRAVIKATIGLARELGINLIAEGVETTEQLELLKSWGCAEAQGYYFARPMSAADVTALLASGSHLPVAHKSAVA